MNYRMLAPKITGMIIDLPMKDLNTAIESYEQLSIKAKEAQELLAPPQSSNN